MNQKIQNLIDQWKENNKNSEPETIYLNSYKDYDGIKHINNIIFIHNHEYNNRVQSNIWLHVVT
jgi:hypothetical protein